MKISVVIPVFQGAGTIVQLAEKLVSSLKPYDLEIVLVNDGSTDNSHEMCLSLFKRYGAIVKYICLSKNFGEHNAVMAGLAHTTGDYAVIVDDDFQNPPEEIETLVKKAVSGKFDVVYGYYAKKEHSLFRNLGSGFNNLVASFLLNKPRDLYLSSFKCMSRFIVSEVVKYNGPFPYIDGLIWRSTRNIGEVLVRHEKRHKGKSGYTLRKLLRLWTNMFVNFSVYPLRMSTILGALFSILGALLTIFFIIDKILNPDTPIGVTAILTSILVFAGVQLIMLGLIGEYVGRLFMTNNQTPSYVVRHAFGCTKEKERYNA
ncbi:MAG: glycosyltransferase family 2 protein [Candidatus Omnitrophica bacterium]|nr:glycosyltransferase family 2 protein [Candidatus Omnitrophota bacterium]